MSRAIERFLSPAQQRATRRSGVKVGPRRSWSAGAEDARWPANAGRRGAGVAAGAVRAGAAALLLAGLASCGVEPVMPPVPTSPVSSPSSAVAPPLAPPAPPAPPPSAGTVGSVPPPPAPPAPPGIDPPPAPPAMGATPPAGASPPPAAPRPQRFIVLGDSIAACSNLGGKNAAACSPGLLYDYLKLTYAPTLTYENHAVGGAVSADVVHWQLPRIEAGPGHALVLVYVGGNDLARYLISLDVSAEQGFIDTLPKVLTVWELIIAALGDRSRFPDGYTLIMNNQYNPFDDCTAAPYFMSERKNQLLRVFNSSLEELAERKGALFADQHTPFLGHGHHHAVRACPHYSPESVPFMGDLIHPNGAGHHTLFQQWRALVDDLYAP
jgi:lysophospholipase L1-like esterase